MKKLFTIKHPGTLELQAFDTFDQAYKLYEGFNPVREWDLCKCYDSRGITKIEKEPAEAEKVNHPPHYNAHPSGVECIDITRHMNFNLGNAIKYIWRAGLKSLVPREDLEKAVWYLRDELARIEKEQAHGKKD